MTREAPGGSSSGSGTGYSPAATDAAPGLTRRQDEAVQRFLRALDQVGREVEIAAMTLDGCEDLEATAYHLRRALAHIKFAGAELVELRKIKT